MDKPPHLRSHVPDVPEEPVTVITLDEGYWKARKHLGEFVEHLIAKGYLRAEGNTWLSKFRRVTGDGSKFADVTIEIKMGEIGNPRNLT